MVIAPGGEVLYKKEGKIDILEVRRTILTATPDSKGYLLLTYRRCESPPASPGALGRRMT